MLEKLLPATVVAVEAFDDPPGATLFPEEEALLGRAVDKRRREFTTARHCARQALGHLGVSAAPILPGPRGAPQWPLGVVGSMTHCDGYRAAAVARSADVVTVGVDAEPHARLPDGVLEAIALPEERARVRELGELMPGVHWARLLFCAKESVYKAWFPLTRRWLDFHEASIVFDPFAETFDARLLVAGPQVGGERLHGFVGRWAVGQELAMTAIAVAR